MLFILAYYAFRYAVFLAQIMLKNMVFALHYAKLISSKFCARSTCPSTQQARTSACIAESKGIQTPSWYRCWPNSITEGEEKGRVSHAHAKMRPRALFSGLEKSAAIRPFATKKSRLASEKILLADSLATESCRLTDRLATKLFFKTDNADADRT